MGAILALVVGLALPRFASPNADGSGLLFVLGFGALTFAALAVIAPWLAGGYLDVELSPIYSGILTLVVGGAFGLSGRWLASSPFSSLAWFSIIATGFMVLLFLFCLGRWAVLKSSTRKNRSRA